MAKILGSSILRAAQCDSAHAQCCGTVFGVLIFQCVPSTKMLRPNTEALVLGTLFFICRSILDGDYLVLV